MPLGLVNRVLRAHDLIDRPLSSGDVYKLSRDMDVSYAACIWRLRTLELLSPTTARAFVHDGAAAAKATLRDDAPIADARADVYLIDELADGLKLAVRVGDEIWLRLPERRSSGYIWDVGTSSVSASRPIRDEAEAAEAAIIGRDPAARPQIIRVAIDRCRESPRPRASTHSSRPDDTAPKPSRIGTGSLREIGLLATGPGEARLHLQLRRPWSTDTPAASADLTVAIRPARTLDGFTPQQTSAHAARLRSG